MGGSTHNGHILSPIERSDPVRVFLRSPSTILPTRPHSLTTQSQYIHYTIHSFSFTDTCTIAPLSTPSPSTSTLLNSPHQLHWDPNTRDKSCFMYITLTRAPPRNFCISANCLCSSLDAEVSDPAVKSLCPPRNLVLQLSKYK